MKIMIFKLVSILAENHIQKRIQTQRAIKSSLATSEQAGENYGDVDVDCEPITAEFCVILLCTAIFLSLNSCDFKIIR